MMCQSLHLLIFTSVCTLCEQVSVQKSGHSGFITLRPVVLAMSFVALRIRSLQGQKPLIYKWQGFIAMLHKNLTLLLPECESWFPLGSHMLQDVCTNGALRHFRYVCPIHLICVETKDLLHMDSIHLRNVAFLKCNFYLSFLYVVPRERHKGSNYAHVYWAKALKAELSVY